MIGWKPAKLKDICTQISYGYTASATDENTGVKFLRITDIVNQSIDWDLVPFCNISESNYEKYKIENGDIVIARTGATVGYAKQIKPRSEKSVFASYLIRIKIDKGTDKYFIGLLIESITYKNYIKTIAGGAAQPNANAKDLTSFNFSLPPLTIQKKIAAVLSTYDDLIENNNRRITILEKMAEEIYREWFVRMRFPGREKVKFHKGVPEGWEVEKVNKLGKIITGKTPSTKVAKYYNGDYLFIKTPDMHANMFVFETEETLTEKGFKSQPSQTIPKNSICISCIGTGGVVSITTGTCQTNQQINTVVLREESDLEWAFFTLRNLKETIKLFGAIGTTMTNLSKGKFSSIKILLPYSQLREAYHDTVNPIFDQTRTIVLSNSTLRKTRNLLLSRLLSGKLSVENPDIKFPPGMEETDA